MGNSAFAGHYFMFNSTGKLNVPAKDHRYDSLDSADKDRLRNLLKDPKIAEKLGTTGTDLKSALDEYHDVGSALMFWDTAGELADVESKMPNALEKLASLNEEDLIGLKSDDDYFYSDEHDPEGIPKFCENYPQIVPSQVDSYFSAESGDENDFYNGCHNNESVSVELQDLTRNIAEITNNGMSAKEDKAQDYLLKLVASKALEKREAYLGFYDGLPKVSDELRSCLESKKNKYPEFYKSVKATIDEQDEIVGKVIEDPTGGAEESAALKKGVFTNQTVSRALAADYYFSKIKELQASLASTERVPQRICRNGANTPQCRAHNENRKAEIASLKDKIIKEKSKVESLMQEAPTLFQMENEPNFWKFDFANFQVKPSPLLTKIASSSGNAELKQSFADKIKASEEANADLSGPAQRVKALQELGNDEAIQEKFQAFVGTLNEDSSFDNAMKAGVAKQMSDMDSHIKDICENDGAYLHQYSATYNGVFEDVMSSASSQDEAKENIVDVQAGLCSMYRKQPPGKSDWNVAKVTGFALVGVGVVASAAGAICTGASLGLCAPVGGALMAGGAATGLAGGSILAADSLMKYHQASLMTDASEAVVLTEWGSIADLIDKRNNQRDAAVNLGVDVALLPLDIIGVGVLRSGRFVSLSDKIADGVRGLRTGTRVAGTADDAVDIVRTTSTAVAVSQDVSSTAISVSDDIASTALTVTDDVTSTAVTVVDDAASGSLAVVDDLGSTALTTVDDATSGGRTTLALTQDVTPPRDIPRLAAPPVRDDVIALPGKVTDDIAAVSDDAAKITDDVVDPTAGRIFPNSTDGASNIPQFKVTEIADFPPQSVGKEIAWTTPKGRVSKQGTVVRFGPQKRSVFVKMADTGEIKRIPLSEINGSSISKVTNGRRAAAAADFTDAMKGQEIAFYSSAGESLTKGKFVQRNRRSVVLEIDGKLVTKPLTDINGDSISLVGQATRRTASAEDFAGAVGQRISYITPAGNKLHSNRLVKRVTDSGVIVQADNGDEVYVAFNRINGESVAVTRRAATHAVEKPVSNAIAIAETTHDTAVTAGAVVDATQGKSTALTVLDDAGNVVEPSTSTALTVLDDAGRIVEPSTSTALTVLDDAGKIIEPSAGTALARVDDAGEIVTTATAAGRQAADDDVIDLVKGVDYFDVTDQRLLGSGGDAMPMTWYGRLTSGLKSSYNDFTNFLFKSSDEAADAARASDEATAAARAARLTRRLEQTAQVGAAGIRADRITASESDSDEEASNNNSEGSEDSNDANIATDPEATPTPGPDTPFDENPHEPEPTPAAERTPVPTIAPAARGNPVTPQFMQTIKKNTYMKQGIY